jgi:hypothetical protein
VDAGRDFSLKFATQTKAGIFCNEALVEHLKKKLTEHDIGCVLIDPFVSAHEVNENDNMAINAVVAKIREVADNARCALGLVHHTRKIAPGQNATIEDARGGSALRGTARFNRVLNLMTEDEGAKAGVANHRYYFRIGDMESNLAPPSSDINRWFEKASVLIPNGEEVGAIREWKWPDAFDGVTAQQAAQVRATIDRMAEPPRADIRSSLWVGQVVADVLGLDLDSPADKAKAKALLSGWIKSDVLRITEGRDARAGRAVQVVVSGSNNPLTTSGDA